MRLRITDEMRRIIYPIISSSITVGVLVFALFSLSGAIGEGGGTKISFGFMFLFLSLSRIPLAVKAHKVDHSKLALIKNIVFVAIYLALAILVFILEENAVTYCIICSIYFFTIVANRICIAIIKNKVFNWICNMFLAAVGLIFAVVPLFILDDPDLLLIAMASCIMVIMILALFDTLAFAFSRMKLKGIIKIMKKTYAFEILYGLVVLMVACSFYFAIMEDGIPSFGDGLWYSFAIVTTIGLGDFSVTGIISRILSVILGVYGLIVVAVITSVIVNFYNEIKDKKDKEEIEKQKVEEETSTNQNNEQDK